MRFTSVPGTGTHRALCRPRSSSPARAARPPRCATWSRRRVPTSLERARRGRRRGPVRARRRRDPVRAAGALLRERRRCGFAPGRPERRGRWRATRSARSARWWPREASRSRTGCGWQLAAGRVMEDAAASEPPAGCWRCWATRTPRAAIAAAHRPDGRQRQRPGPARPLRARARRSTAAVEDAKARAACKAMPLAVTGAFHIAGDGARTPEFRDGARRRSTCGRPRSPSTRARPRRPFERRRRTRARRGAGAAGALARDARSRCATAGVERFVESGPARSSPASSGARCRTPRRACSPSAEMAHA